MPFVSFETRAFKNNLKADVSPMVALMDPTNRVSGIESVFRGPLVRRPYEGIALKERTPAHISVRKADGQFILLNNSLGDTQESDPELWFQARSSGGKERYYTDFSLLQIQESREEKFQLQETFGEDFLFFFDERARFLSCAGTLMNSLDFQWRTLWLENYDKYLRGTRCVENRARVYLSWDDILVEGYIIKCGTTDHANEPHQIPFNFLMVLTGYYSLAAMNLSVLAAYRDAAVVERPGEIAGSRQAEVYANGFPVDLSQGFWERQLQAIFGTADPQQAFQTALQQPGTLMNIQPHLEAQYMHLKSGGAAKEAFADPGRTLGQTGPLLQTVSNWSPNEAQVGGVSTNVLASRRGAKTLFGDDYRATHMIAFLK